MTKNITPVSIWTNGQLVNAVKLLARAIDDDLATTMMLYYELKDSNDAVLTVGNLTLMGTDYLNRNSNQYVWDWVATQLSLTYNI